MPKATLSIHRGEYALVAERVRRFYERFPTGRIITELVSRSEQEVTFRAEVYRSADESLSAATGWASERVGDGDVNTVACLENTETSAVGRALANLGLSATLDRRSREASRDPARVPTPGHPESARRGAPVGDRRAPDESLQQAADAVFDVLNLLAEAERAGLDPHRSSEMRDALLEPNTAPSTVTHTERALRRWLTTVSGTLGIAVTAIRQPGSSA